MSVVKEYIDVLMESFFCEMGEEYVFISELRKVEDEWDKLVDRLCKIFLLIINFMIYVILV